MRSSRDKEHLRSIPQCLTQKMFEMLWQASEDLRGTWILYEGYSHALACRPSSSSCDEVGVLSRAETMAMLSSCVLPCNMICQAAEADGKERSVTQDFLSL